MNYYNDNECDNILTLVVFGIYQLGIYKFSAKKFADGLLASSELLIDDDKNRFDGVINMYKYSLDDQDYIDIANRLDGVGYVQRDVENEDVFHISDTIEDEFYSDVDNGQTYTCKARDIAGLIIPKVFGSVCEDLSQDPV